MKKRSSFIIILFLLALVGLSVYIYRSRSRMSSVEGEDRNFKVKDTAAITRIFIADKAGHQSLVERKPTGWVVNNKFNCRSDAILNLLEVIRNVEVKMPVNRAGRESAIRYMSSQALKVEIYAGDELVKQYYVGHETADGEGSYMVLTDLESGENYEDPYVCFIPGFKGYLKPRYIADENDWRDRIVMNFIPPQISQIRVQHLDQPADSSFRIDVAAGTRFRLNNAKGEVLPFDELRMKQYLAYYQNISYEGLITGRSKGLQDSLSRVQPFCIITVQQTNGDKNEFKFYRKAFTGQQDPEHGITYTYDPDRFFLRFDNDRQWALCQYFVFGKLLATTRYFQGTESVKK